ncbi:MAG: flagellar type III secretion system pore protein FliP [Clostridia bacterium]|nr:flagellar type III secretion system pore protein FliP [Clostridia bacterium]
MKNKFKYLIMAVIAVFFVLNISGYAETLPIPKIGLNIEQTDNPAEVATSVQILFLLTIISLAPSILIMMTSFTRIVIVMHFLRSALGTQQTPPNQVIIGLSLFLTFFIMAPTITTINETAVEPYVNGQISQEVAFTRAERPLKDFMLKQTYEKDLKLFVEISKEEIEKGNIESIPMNVVIPAFVISELKKGFMIGFLIYIPFIIIDMVVASTLMAMGMMMLPPSMISMPFKLLLFVVVDGWNLIIGQIVASFR